MGNLVHVYRRTVITSMGHAVNVTYTWPVVVVAISPHPVAGKCGDRPFTAPRICHLNGISGNPDGDINCHPAAKSDSEFIDSGNDFVNSGNFRSN